VENNTFTNYFEVLNITEEAEIEIIHAAYRTLAKKYHPDTTQLKKDIAEPKMALINTAYHILADEETRKRHIKEIAEYKINSQKSFEDSPSTETDESKESEINDEKMGASSYIIIIITCVAFLCCAIYFLPDVIKDAWNNILSSIKEIHRSFVF